MSKPDAPERKDAETLGQALFENETFEGWASLYTINVSSLFFVSTAFLGLLDKGSRELEGYSASIVNISSISALIKLSQDHVSSFLYDLVFS
jgi:NAD(P)-dependent dehydrogenase (short-subunit alcohol dehydrogenase family)